MCVCLLGVCRLGLFLINELKMAKVVNAAALSAIAVAAASASASAAVLRANE